jgi:hypothetical protein
MASTTQSKKPSTTNTSRTHEAKMYNGRTSERDLAWNGTDWQFVPYKYFTEE